MGLKRIIHNQLRTLCLQVASTTILRLLLSFEAGDMPEEWVKLYNDDQLLLHYDYKPKKRLPRCYKNDKNFKAHISRKDTMLVSFIRHPFDRFIIKY